jgi:hypothetical protein
MAVTHNSYKFVTVSLLKWLRNDRFISEAAVRRLQKCAWIQKPLQRRRAWLWLWKCMPHENVQGPISVLAH